MKMTTINITTGKFSVVVNGTIEDSKVQDLAQKGLVSEIYRKAFPKTELAMARFTGQVVEKDGKVKKAEGFKRDSVAFTKGLATEMQGILALGVQGFGTFSVEVSEYVPGVSATTAEKILAAKLAGLELAKEFMTEEQYATKMAELKGEVVAANEESAE